MKVALYTRYSTDNQRDASISDQFLVGLKLCHFSNDDFPVYPLMYRAFRTMPQRQKLFVYVRCARFNGQSLAEAMFGELDRCPPKAKATRSNRVGCAISSNKSM
jgi:hypothetical protein